MNKKPTNLLGQAKRHHTKIRPKAIGGGIFRPFSSFDKCRPKAAGDVMSGVAVDYVGMDVNIKVGDSTLNRGLIIRLFADRTRLRNLMQYLTEFCSREEAASDVISGRFVKLIVRDKSIKFCDPRKNIYEGIRPEAVGGAIFDSFIAVTSDREKLVTSYSVRL